MNWTLLFDMVIEGLSWAGGDGDVVIWFRKRELEEVATEFHKYQQQHPTRSKWPLARYAGGPPNSILFSDGGNENVIFTKDKAQRSPWQEDLYMEVW